MMPKNEIEKTCRKQYEYRTLLFFFSFIKLLQNTGIPPSPPEVVVKFLRKRPRCPVGPPVPDLFYGMHLKHGIIDNTTAMRRSEDSRRARYR